VDPAAWSAVDALIGDKLIGAPDPFQAVLDANAKAGLPAIDVSPAQAKLLHLLVRISGARRVLEIGTLGGYSAAWLASALEPGGALVTLELSPAYAALARTNLERAGLADRVEVRLGPALQQLEKMVASGEAPFDFIFLDADKANNPSYVRLGLRLSRPGTVIVCDNVVRQGALLDAASNDPAVLGTRGLFDVLRDEPRLSATAIQTVGSKGWDGFAVAMVGPASADQRS
jgi:predicted O-methyltransferase YrrM